MAAGTEGLGIHPAQWLHRRGGLDSRDALPVFRMRILLSARSWSVRCPVVQACGIQALVRPWELGSTDTIVPQYCTLQRSSAVWLFCSPCHELNVEEKGKKGPHRGFPLP